MFFKLIYAAANAVVLQSNSTTVNVSRETVGSSSEPLKTSACQRQIGSVDNPKVFNFALSDIEEMCQQWGSTVSQHWNLTSNNLDSTLPLVVSHWRSSTFISLRSRSAHQRWSLAPNTKSSITMPHSTLFLTWKKVMVIDSYWYFYC